MSMSRMIRLGTDTTHFDASVTALIEDAEVKLPPGTVFEIRYGILGTNNDLAWISNDGMQTEPLWARQFHGAAFAPVQGVSNTCLVARLKTAPAPVLTKIEDVTAP